MSYRDDTEAAHARVAALEEELARTRAELAALKGDQKHALVVASATAIQQVPKQRTAARGLGAPTVLVFSVATGEAGAPTLTFSRYTELWRNSIWSCTPYSRAAQRACAR